MATGKRPFDEVEPSQLIGAIVRRTAQPPSALNPRVSPELERIVGKCLEKEPENRYQSAKELAVDLRRMVTSGITIQPPSVRRARKSWAWKAAAAGLVLGALVVGGGGLFFRSRRVHALTKSDTIVLADFVNTTGDPVFDGALRQGLSFQLGQSPFLNLLSDERIAQTLSLMTQSSDVRLTPRLAREVCQRTASAATIEGSIASLGSQYVLGLRAVNCGNGDLLAQEQVTANGKERVLGVLGEAATKMRAKLGESLVTVRKDNASFSNVTTSSLEALKAYSLGQEAVSRLDWPSAITFFQRAIVLDHNFAMAYGKLAGMYGNLGETQRQAENIQKAYELRDRVSDRERFYLTSRYQYFVGDIEAARKTAEMWVEMYPREAPFDLLGTIYEDLGDYEKALASYKEGMRRNPGPPSPMDYVNLVGPNLELNRFEEAKAAEKRRRPDTSTPLKSMFPFTGLPFWNTTKRVWSARRM